MNRAYFVIIRGPLGVGKTIIAKKLSKKLRAEYISIDKILDKYKIKIDVEEPKKKQNFLKTNEIAAPQAIEKLRKGKKVVFDGNFYYKEQIENLIEKIFYPHFVFTLKADLNTCIKRDAARKKTYGKEAAAAVHKFTSSFDYGKIIDTENKTEEKVVEEILRYLPK